MRDTFLIKRIVITERTSDLESLGKYVFEVQNTATKNEVKKAVKDVYGVDAVQVNIVNLPSKSKRYRGKKSERSGFKKAIVTLQSGQKIDIGR